MTRPLYGLIVLFITATVYLLSTVSERQAVLRHVVHHNDAWAVSQAVQEILRLENALALYMLEDRASQSDVRLRLDIVISRLDSLQEGSLGAFLRKMSLGQQTFAQLTSITTNLDKTFETLDGAQLRTELARLHDIVRPVSNLPAQAVQQSWATAEQNLDALERLQLVFGVVVAFLIMCWCGLVLLLLRQNRLLKVAQEQGKILYDNLDAAGEELRDKNRSLEYAAYHDSLTALPNRTMFWNEIETCIKSSTAGEKIISLLLIDLDDFKSINDTLGHDFGDILLHQVSERMRQFARSPHIFCRMGGDEFACLLLGRTAEESLFYARELAADIAAPYQVLDRKVKIGCSIGLAVTKATSETDTGLLFKRADIALYCAKGSELERVCLFEQYMQREFDDRKVLEDDLRHAIEQRAIDVAYQIQVDVHSVDLRGVEALARWTHPTRGSVPPSVFIPVAEEIGLIADLGLLILAKACAEASTWSKEAMIAVNLSALQLQSSGFVEAVQNVLVKTGLDPRRLEFEITESVLLDKREDVFQTLFDLRKIGVKIAMDDFGTGYSSLAVLRDMPFDTIKLDKTFIHDIASDEVAQALVRFIIDLGRLLKKEIIVEGIETAEQHAIVQHLGCDAVQGFLFGRPVSASCLGCLRQHDSIDMDNIA